jgi:3-hydroxyisobutyrate dehydrogenase-like beta-hydroxyacid dehydrogenase
MLKDLRAVDDLARTQECRLPMMAAALAIYRRAGEPGVQGRAAA